MKIYLTFKTPDALEDAAREQAERVKEAAAEEDTLTTEEIEERYEKTYNEVLDAGKKWFQYGEYVNVVLDTETGTCTVKPV